MLGYTFCNFLIAGTLLQKYLNYGSNLIRTGNTKDSFTIINCLFSSLKVSARPSPTSSHGLIPKSIFGPINSKAGKYDDDGADVYAPES